MEISQLFAVVRSSSGTAGLIQSELADGVGVKQLRLRLIVELIKLQLE